MKFADRLRLCDGLGLEFYDSLRLCDHHANDFCDRLKLCNNFTMNSKTVSRAATTHAVSEVCDSLRLCDRQDHDFCDSLRLFEQPYLEFCNRLRLCGRTLSFGRVSSSTTIPLYIARASQAL